jgi:hypothetical protein
MEQSCFTGHVNTGSRNSRLLDVAGMSFPDNTACRVRTNDKLLRLAACAALPLLLTSGCDGIQAQRTVSPATFIMPGLLKADPPPDQKSDCVASTIAPAMSSGQIPPI